MNKIETTAGIRMILKSMPIVEGDGVHLKRAFGFREAPAFDPFLMLDDFRSSDPRDYIRGFPSHPHRGMETITYVLHGKIEHEDSMGNKGVIHAGDVQWMTAGSGIIHQEMPKGDESGRMEGFQLWANLPAAEKMMAPRYREVKSDEIPVISVDDGVTIRIICGEVQGVRGPVRDIVTDPEYLDITVPSKTEFTIPTKAEYTVITYTIEGKAQFSREKGPFPPGIEGAGQFDMSRSYFAANGNCILFGDGDQIVVSTESEPVRFLFISGKPIGEPLAWSGPIVMNTQKELDAAFDELRHGTFIRHENT